MPNATFTVKELQALSQTAENAPCEACRKLAAWVAGKTKKEAGSPQERLSRFLKKKTGMGLDRARDAIRALLLVHTEDRLNLAVETMARPGMAHFDFCKAVDSRWADAPAPRDTQAVGSQGESEARDADARSDFDRRLAGETVGSHPLDALVNDLLRRDGGEGV